MSKVAVLAAKSALPPAASSSVEPGAQSKGQTSAQATLDPAQLENAIPTATTFSPRATRASRAALSSILPNSSAPPAKSNAPAPAKSSGTFIPAKSAASKAPAKSIASIIPATSVASTPSNPKAAKASKAKAADPAKPSGSSKTASKRPLAKSIAPAVALSASDETGRPSRKANKSIPVATPVLASDEVLSNTVVDTSPGGRRHRGFGFQRIRKVEPTDETLAKVISPRANPSSSKRSLDADAGSESSDEEISHSAARSLLDRRRKAPPSAPASKGKGKKRARIEESSPIVIGAPEVMDEFDDIADLVYGRDSSPSPVTLPQPTASSSKSSLPLKSAMKPTAAPPSPITRVVEDTPFGEILVLQDGGVVPDTFFSEWERRIKVPMEGRTMGIAPEQWNDYQDFLKMVDQFSRVGVPASSIPFPGSGEPNPSDSSQQGQVPSGSKLEVPLFPATNRGRSPRVVQSRAPVEQVHRRSRDRSERIRRDPSRGRKLSRSGDRGAHHFSRSPVDPRDEAGFYHGPVDHYSPHRRSKSREIPYRRRHSHSRSPRPILPRGLGRRRNSRSASPVHRHRSSRSSSRDHRQVFPSRNHRGSPSRDHYYSPPQEHRRPASRDRRRRRSSSRDQYRFESQERRTLRRPRDFSIVSTPDAVQAVLESGWLSFIGLGCLTASAIRSAREKSLAKSMTYHLDKDSGKIVPQVRTVDNSGDLTLTFVGFLEAAPLMVKAIRSFYVPHGRSRTGSSLALEYAAEYESIFEYVRCREDVQKQWASYNEYLSTVMRHDLRSRAEGYSCDIGTFDDKLFTSIAWSHLRQDATEARSLSSISQSRPATKAAQQPSFRTKKAGSAQSARGPTSIPVAAVLKAYRCWLCGLTDHHWKNCSGPSKAVEKKGDNRYCFASGEAICIGFNGQNGCTKPGCVFGHFCSICGDKSKGHGAQQCTAT
ncbi:hypothetical protein C8J56DRAFT_504310 [Mycena floridula]|nr:hypothetical protein C8J56DRAFT_504310 [Mycena floridula]